MMITPRAPRIAIFDSGVGGLSIADEIARAVPQAVLSLIVDNGFFPYGDRAEPVLINRVEQVVAAAVEAVAADVVVIACNTASTVALPRLRDRLLVPVVGVVPAIKPAALLSRRRVIGLLGTAGTVRRAYTQDLIDRFAADCTVLRVGSGELVALAEQALAGAPPPPERLRAILAPFFAGPSADIIVLACTHFPLLRAELAAAAPPGIVFIDSGRAVADRVRAVLGTPSGPALGDGLARVWFTENSPALRQRLAGFAAHGFVETGLLSV